VVALHREKLPGVSLYNEYGPSEGTVWVTVAKLDDVRSDGCVPIGRPINNLTAYVLDRQGKPTPLGLPGELYVGGAGVARGYLNQPVRTREVFIRNPFRSSPDPVLYKTGDMVRYLDDGNIEFLGRVDNQVKIRGYRVELEEIEQALKSHPRVNDAVVVLEQSALHSSQTGSICNEPLVNLLLSDDTGAGEQILAEIEQLGDEEIGLMQKKSGTEYILTGSSQS
jgi:acyl-coenzyme A synthetase/AMP-(fatty) acid ligase